MQRLTKGESPVISARIPRELHAAVKAVAGPGRGATSRWLAALVEREMARISTTGDAGHAFVTLDKQHRKASNT